MPVQTRPDPAAILGFEQPTPFASRVERLIVTNNSRQTVNASSTGTVRIKSIEGRIVGVDVLDQLCLKGHR
jgi:hypothetical protein